MYNALYSGVTTAWQHALAKMGLGLRDGDIGFSTCRFGEPRSWYNGWKLNFKSPKSRLSARYLPQTAEREREREKTQPAPASNINERAASAKSIEVYANEAAPVYNATYSGATICHPPTHALGAEQVLLCIKVLKRSRSGGPGRLV